MKNIIFTAEELFGHVLESERGVLLISCFDGTFSDIKKRYMTVIGKETEGDVVFISERMNLDLGEAVADFYRRSGAITNYTPLNNASDLLDHRPPQLGDLIRVPTRNGDNVSLFPFSDNHLRCVNASNKAR